MDFAIILAVTIVGCFALRNPLKALPVAFYAAAIAIDVVYMYGVFFGLPRAIWSPFGRDLTVYRPYTLGAREIIAPFWESPRTAHGSSKRRDKGATSPLPPR